MSVLARSITLAAMIILALPRIAAAQELILEDLITRALNDNPQIKASAARSAASHHRISQKGSLTDPRLSLGYENDGTEKYTYGEMTNSKWMIGLSQTFAYPGKLGLQEQAAQLESESEKALLETLRREVAYQVSAAYYDLLLITKEIDILHALQEVAGEVEKTVLAQYATGIMSQDDALMAQTEKYLLMERLALAESKKTITEARLRQQTGWPDSDALGSPREDPPTDFSYDPDELMQQALKSSPELKAGENLALASAKKLERSRKEALPDVTVTASYTKKGGDFQDMVGLSASIPLPVYYSGKQGAGASEAAWSVNQAQLDLQARKLKILADMRESLAVIKTADDILTLYDKALQPRARQQIDAALALLATGKVNASQALSKLKPPFEYELNAWRQRIQREKAIARIKAIIGDPEASQ